MLIWIWLPLLIIFSIVILFLASPPTFVANWFVEKMELHPKLDEEAVTVNIDNNYLEGEEKSKIINYFNKSFYIERYGFLPGTGDNPIIINTKRAKTQVRYEVYCYNEHVDVFRYYKKKVVAYRIISNDFQNSFNSQTSILVGV